jgi:hypothetical protein
VQPWRRWHPEEHRLISPSALWDALRKKEEVANRAGIQAHIVTQFSFSPNDICLWDKGLQQNAISLPVHIGVAGPTSLRKLIKFAVHCGVCQSLNAVMKNMNPGGFVVTLQLHLMRCCLAFFASAEHISIPPEATSFLRVWRIHRNGSVDAGDRRRPL